MWLTGNKGYGAYKTTVLLGHRSEYGWVAVAIFGPLGPFDVALEVVPPTSIRIRSSVRYKDGVRVRVRSRISSRIWVKVGLGLGLSYRRTMARLVFFAKNPISFAFTEKLDGFVSKASRPFGKRTQTDRYG